MLFRSTAGHLSGTRFNLLAGIKAVQVAYKGGPEVMIELISGRSHYAVTTMGSALPFITEGKLTALAVTTPKRASQLADVPTMLEAGLKGFEMTNWYGMMAPAKISRDIITRLNTEVNKIMALPDAKAKLEEVGTQLNPMTPEAFAKFLESELAKYAKLVKAANVSID